MLTRLLCVRPVAAPGRFEQAVQSYTEAIELDGKNHVFYSNRSAAYMNLGKKDEALKDAKKCTSLNPGWWKGHNRVGRALFAKRLFGQAAAAYKKALELDPDNATLKQKVAQAEQEDRYTRGIEQRPASASRGGGGGGGGYAYPSSTGSRAGSSGGGWGDPNAGLFACMFGSVSAVRKTVQFGLRFAILLSAITYLLPVGGRAAFGAYRKAMGLALVNYIIQLGADHGRPRWSQAYAGRVMQDFRAHYVFLALLFYTSRPVALALAPVLLAELGWLADYGSALLARTVPPLGRALDGLAARLVAPRCNSTAEQWPSLARAVRYSRWNAKSLAWGAVCEMSVGLLLLVELVTPFRSLVTTLVFWQFMRIRYMVSPEIKTAFGALHRAIVGKVGTTGVLGGTYGKISGFLGHMVEMPQPGQQAGSSGASRCNIM